MAEAGGRFLARYLEESAQGYEPFTPSDPEGLRTTLQPGDVLLVEGSNNISGTIKYLTQSTWSHAALYVGPILEIRHSSLYAPRDLDISPYLEVVKPTR